LLNVEVNYYFEVTPADVQRAVAKYLTPARTTRVVVRPEAAAPAASGGQ
jgi:predicted Zn-dependent peptidase